jgi:Ser/Thr protein kinase RdoA (MazF antagonist)
MAQNARGATERPEVGILPGDIQDIALVAGRVLGRIHRASWGDEFAAETFDSTSNFFELRLDPYLLTTASRHPELATYLEAESQRIQETQLCLVHGDYSPKNMLIRDSRLVLLDCEVAWYGEPAFDAAFLLNHFLLKSLHFSVSPEPYLELVSCFWSAYAATLGEPFIEGLEARVVHLLPMLLLARIDGKSPAEYITDPQKKDLVRQFVAGILPGSPIALSEFLAIWRGYLSQSKGFPGKP